MPEPTLSVLVGRLTLLAAQKEEAHERETVDRRVRRGSLESDVVSDVGEDALLDSGERLGSGTRAVGGRHHLEVPVGPSERVVVQVRNRAAGLEGIRREQR